jgi:DNA (cytosine-5)-methyltransferase 1
MAQEGCVKELLLDLFCGEGGAGMGYFTAGFDVVGVDINAQPNYPFPFRQADAIDVLQRLVSGGVLAVERRSYRLRDFAVIHASPPCQAHLNLTRVNESMGRDHGHVDLIAATRDLLVESGLPYVIENVADARSKLRDPVRVCGTSFDLPLRRHRLFESNVEIAGTDCEHGRFAEKKYWTGWRPKGKVVRSTVVQVYGNAAEKHEWPAAMGIDWMTDRGMSEAIPPAYSKHIGRQLMAARFRPLDG